MKKRWKQLMCLLLCVTVALSSVGITPAIHAEASETVSGSNLDDTSEDDTTKEASETVSGSNLDDTSMDGKTGDDTSVEDTTGDDTSVANYALRAAAENYLFQDDFSGDLSKWTSVMGSGTVQDGYLQAKTAQYSPADTTMFTTGDLEISVEGKPTGSWFGIQFNMQNTGVRNWDKTGYLLYIKNNGTVELLSAKETGSGKVTIGTTNVSNFDKNTTTKLTVKYTASEAKIDVYINDSTTPAFTATESIIHTEGYFGLACDGNCVFENFTVQGTKKEAASDNDNTVPITASEAAKSITSLDIDYDNGTLVLPEIEGITVEIESSSDENVISKNGEVDIVYGGTTDVKLKLTDTESNIAYTEINITVDGVLQKMVEAGDIKSVTASSSHATWPESHLINGNSSVGFWSNGDYAAEQVEIVLTMEEASEVTGVILYPRVSPADNSGATFFPENFEIFVSKDNEDWTSVKEVSNYQTNNSTDPQTFYFTAQKDVQYVKLVINRGNSKYIQLAEVEVLVVPELQTAAEAAKDLTVKHGEGKVVIENVTEQFRTEITAANPTGIVGTDGSLTLPEKDTEVTLTIEVKNLLDSSDEATAERKLLIKSQATLDVEAVAETVDLIPCPANDAAQLTLPAVPAGYTITIKESDHPNVVNTSGKIMRSDDTTYGVRLTFEVKNTSTGASALTKSLLVPIYKTYVAPTMSQEEIAKIHEDYESKAYGVFVHYISEFGSCSGSLYADGTNVKTVDELAGAFDAAQFAKDMNDFGVEYVMLTIWHGDARALFPSMTNERWRDDRRAEDSTTKKSYSERDVIADLLDELDKYDIDLHLYTHPCDGHDFVAEDQALTGWNDSEGGYATWNQFINELYYEVCERYGDRIKGLWFDGFYTRSRGDENQSRLRETCLSFNPAMILTMNTGFLEGELNPKPDYTCPDYRAWEVNRYVDFVNDMVFSRYQSAIVLASQGWWTTRAQSKTFKIQSAEDIFQYIVAMASVSTHGGFVASTGFYPNKEGLDLNGDFWMNGIRNTLVKVNNSYLAPVAEAVKNTSIGKAFPTTENQTVSQLEWGVSTESRDGRYVYLHVLNKPNGNTLTLPETADGTILRSDAVIMNFDGTTTPVTIEKISANARSTGGYSITLPEGVSWSDVDTVIRAERTSVTGVTLDTETKEMKTGETATLTATVQPEDAYDKSVTWTSSDTSVVTVDENGNLKAVGVGEATITVTTKDGGYTDTCKVTVTKAQTPSDTTGNGSGNSGTQGSQSDKNDTNNKNDKDDTTEFVGRYEAKKNTTTTASNPSTGDSGYAQYVLLLAAAVMLFVVVSCYYKRREK